MEGCQWNAIERLKNPLVMTEETSPSSSNRMNDTKDRVVLQCYHNEELQIKGETTMPDQGIVFDGSQKPRDLRPGQKIKKKGFQPAGSKGWLNEKNTKNMDTRRWLRTN